MLKRKQQNPYYDEIIVIQALRRFCVWCSPTTMFITYSLILPLQPGGRFTLWQTHAIKEDMSGVKSLTALSGLLNIISHGTVKSVRVLIAKVTLCYLSYNW